jgi:ribose transport system substrate-binding protein
MRTAPPVSRFRSMLILAFYDVTVLNRRYHSLTLNDLIAILQRPSEFTFFGQVKLSLTRADSLVIMKRLDVVVSLVTQDNDFQLEQAASAQEAAIRCGVEVEIVYAGGDSIQQSQQILKFVQADRESRPDGIILEPVGETGLPQVARAAAAAGIGWVLLNLKADYIKELRQSFKVPVFAVAADNLEVGRIQGRQMAALLPQGGTVLYIQGPWGAAAARLRTEGLEETKPSEIQIKAMKGAWTESSAFNVVTNWLRLSTSQEIPPNLIVAQNDAMVMGAKKALQQFGFSDSKKNRWLSIPLLGCDGLPKTGQAWVHSGILAATIITPPIAGQSMDMLVHALKSHAPQQDLTTVVPRSFPALESLTSRFVQAARIGRV